MAAHGLQHKGIANRRQVRDLLSPGRAVNLPYYDRHHQRSQNRHDRQDTNDFDQGKPAGAPLEVPYHWDRTKTTAPQLGYFMPAGVPQTPSLINTLLQRGVWRPKSIRNRFNGFRSGRETVETVSEVLPARDTPLKQGVNESVIVHNNLGFVREFNSIWRRDLLFNGLTFQLPGALSYLPFFHENGNTQLRNCL